MTIYWPDIASYQAGIDLSGALVVFAKATEDTGYINPEFGAFKAEAARHGVFFAAYHFLSTAAPALQAEHAHAVAGSVPLMLDFEPAATRPGLPHAVAFIDAYRKAGGRCHLVYLPHWYWQQIGSPPLGPLASRGMSLVSSNYSGRYTDAASGAGWQPYGGMAPAVWQYSSSTPFNRQSVDFNAYRGSVYAGKQDSASVAACLAEFRALATTGKLAPVDPPARVDAYRHAVGPGETRTLSGVARACNTTLAALATFSRSHLNEANAEILDTYLALCRALWAQGKPGAAMPEGLVYWTRHP